MQYCSCCSLLIRSRAAEVERQPCVFILILIALIASRFLTMT